MRFQKQPVVLEAWHFDGTLASIGSLLACSGALTVAGDAADLHAEIATVEGVMRAYPGDWIIRARRLGQDGLITTKEVE